MDMRSRERIIWTVLIAALILAVVSAFWIWPFSMAEVIGPEGDLFAIEQTLGVTDGGKTWIDSAQVFLPEDSAGRKELTDALAQATYHRCAQTLSGDAQVLDISRMIWVYGDGVAVGLTDTSYVVIDETVYRLNGAQQLFTQVERALCADVDQR